MLIKKTLNSRLLLLCCCMKQLTAARYLKDPIYFYKDERGSNVKRNSCEHLLRLIAPQLVLIVSRESGVYRLIGCHYIQFYCLFPFQYSSSKLKGTMSLRYQGPKPKRNLTISEQNKMQCFLDEKSERKYMGPKSKTEGLCN